MPSSHKISFRRGVALALLVLTDMVVSASIFAPSTTSTSTTTTRATSTTATTDAYSTTVTKSTYSPTVTTTSSQTNLQQDLEVSPSVNLPQIGDQDPRNIQKNISTVHFDSHKYTWLPLEERVAETELEITETECEDYLKKFGYMVIDCDRLHGKLRDLCLVPSLNLFQNRMEINVTGICDNATKHQMAIPRCDFPDYMTKDTARQKRFNIGKLVRKLYVEQKFHLWAASKQSPFLEGGVTGMYDDKWASIWLDLKTNSSVVTGNGRLLSEKVVERKTKWEKSDMPLEIKFDQYNSLMDRKAQEKAMMEAAQRWADVSGLSFVKGTSRNAKIRIGFTNHDGPWGVLGRAWFPKVGKILFEKRENWITELPKNGKDSGKLMFFSVAMHELGHALGISHSNVKNAIMHGQYQRDVLELQSDDIKAVRKLYGPNTKKASKEKQKSSNSSKSNSSNKSSNSNNRSSNSNNKSSNSNNRSSNSNNKSSNSNNKSSNSNNKSSNSNNRSSNSNNRSSTRSNDRNTNRNNNRNINRNSNRNNNRNSSRDNNRNSRNRNSRSRNTKSQNNRNSRNNNRVFNSRDRQRNVFGGGIANGQVLQG